MAARTITQSHAAITYNWAQKAGNTYIIWLAVPKICPVPSLFGNKARRATLYSMRHDNFSWAGATFSEGACPTKDIRSMICRDKPLAPLCDSYRLAATSHVALQCIKVPLRFSAYSYLLVGDWSWSCFTFTRSSRLLFIYCSGMRRVQTPRGNKGCCGDDILCESQRKRRTGTHLRQFQMLLLFWNSCQCQSTLLKRVLEQIKITFDIKLHIRAPLSSWKCMYKTTAIKSGITESLTMPLKQDIIMMLWSIITTASQKSVLHMGTAVGK